MKHNFTTEQKKQIFIDQSIPFKDFKDKDRWFITLGIRLNRKDLIEILCQELDHNPEYFSWYSWSELVNSTNKALKLDRFNEEVLSY